MRELTLLIQGMICSGCIKSITDCILNLKGTTSITEISLASSKGIFQYQESKCNPKRITRAINKIGFKVIILKDMSVNSILKLKFPESIDFEEYIILQDIFKKGYELSSQPGPYTNDTIYEIFIEYNPNIINPNDIHVLVQRYTRCFIDCIENNRTLQEINHLTNDAVVKSILFRELYIKIHNFEYETYQTLLKEQIELLDSTTKIEKLIEYKNVIKIIYNAKHVTLDEIISKIKLLGIEFTIESKTDLSLDCYLKKNVNIYSDNLFYWKQKIFLRILISECLIIILYIVIPIFFLPIFDQQNTLNKKLHLRDVIGFIVCTYVQFFVGFPYYLITWNFLKHAKATFDTWICLASTVAYITTLLVITENYFEPNKETNFEVSSILFIIPLSLLMLGSLTKIVQYKMKIFLIQQVNKATKYVFSQNYSIDISKTETEDEPVPIDNIQPNDIIKIIPGQNFPFDGMIIKGITEISEDIYTGKIKYVCKKMRDRVTKGSINGPCDIICKVLRVYPDIELHTLINAIQQIFNFKAPSQMYIDKLITSFICIVLILSASSLAIWYFINKQVSGGFNLLKDFNSKILFKCFSKITTIIIISCPASLGFGIPMAFMVGNCIAAKKGVIFKGTDKIEKLSKIQVIIFDKTGTLTCQALRIKNVNIDKSEIDKEIIDLSTLIECFKQLCQNEHLVSKAMYEYLDSTYISSNTMDIKQILIQPKLGFGVRGKFSVKPNTLDCQSEEGTIFEIGIGRETLYPSIKNQKYICEKEEEPEFFITEYIFLNNKVIGHFDLVETIKKDSIDTIEYLNNEGYNMFVITGDKYTNGIRVARDVGLHIGQVYADMPPYEKSKVIESLKKEHGDCIAFVGDGINDSPAMCEGTIGITFSTGSTTTIENSDIILMNNRNTYESTLWELVEAIKISKSTMNKIKLCKISFFTYNIIMIPMAMGLFEYFGIHCGPIQALLCTAVCMISNICVVLTLKLEKLQNRIKGYLPKLTETRKKVSNLFSSSNNHSEQLL